MRRMRIKNNVRPIAASQTMGQSMNIRGIGFLWAVERIIQRRVSRANASNINSRARRWSRCIMRARKMRRRRPSNKRLVFVRIRGNIN